MKYRLPFTNPDTYRNDKGYLMLWFRSVKTYLDNSLASDGVVFVKDVLESFCFTIGGADPDFLALKWVSPIRTGYRHKHDKRYKVKMYLRENKRRSLPGRYHLIIDVYDPDSDERTFKIMEDK